MARKKSRGAIDTFFLERECKLRKAKRNAQTEIEKVVKEASCLTSSEEQNLIKNKIKKYNDDYKELESKVIEEYISFRDSNQIPYTYFDKHFWQLINQLEDQAAARLITVFKKNPPPDFDSYVRHHRFTSPLITAAKKEKLATVLAMLETNFFILNDVYRDGNTLFAVLATELSQILDRYSRPPSSEFFHTPAFFRDSAKSLEYILTNTRKIIALCLQKHADAKATYYEQRVSSPRGSVASFFTDTKIIKSFLGNIASPEFLGLDWVEGHEVDVLRYRQEKSNPKILNKLIMNNKRMRLLDNALIFPNNDKVHRKLLYYLSIYFNAIEEFTTIPQSIKYYNDILDGFLAPDEIPKEVLDLQNLMLGIGKELKHPEFDFLYDESIENTFDKIRLKLTYTESNSDSKYIKRNQLMFYIRQCIVHRISELDLKLKHDALVKIQEWYRTGSFFRKYQKTANQIKTVRNDILAYERLVNSVDNAESDEKLKSNLRDIKEGLYQYGENRTSYSKMHELMSNAMLTFFHRQNSYDILRASQYLNNINSTNKQK